MTEQPSQPRSSFVLHETEDGRTRIPCRFKGETPWLTQVSGAEAQCAHSPGTSPGP
jgi:hypothetical protein